uniref:SDR family NAD(P)-dependent oxidoreductase n=1 Tax=Steinernema glaseri TaxID=37863 RepID=A0A1I7YQ42_9BILA
MEPQKFAGKVVIVTGSSSGIGQGIALLLAQQGAAVTIHGRSLDGLKETEKLLTDSGVNPHKILTVQGDIVEPETAEKLINETVEKFGQIDVLMEPQKFAGKVVIVTGSSSGIGQGIALLLAQQGAAVTIHGRSLDGLKETEKLLTDSGVNPHKILTVQGDIVEPETAEKLVNETVEKFGQIDVLVGYLLLDLSVIRLNKLAIPHLEKTRGNIVNVSSIAAIKPVCCDGFTVSCWSSVFSSLESPPIPCRRSVSTTT